MEPLFSRLKSLVESKNPVNEDVMSVLLAELERFPITLHHLQTTRIGRLLNDLRRREGVSNAGNTRIRNIIKSWQNLVSDASSALLSSAVAAPPPVPTTADFDRNTIQPDLVNSTRPSKQNTRPPRAPPISSPSPQIDDGRSRSSVKNQSNIAPTTSQASLSSQRTASSTLKAITTNESTTSLSSPVIQSTADSAHTTQKNKRFASTVSDFPTSDSTSSVHSTKKTRQTLSTTNGIKTSPALIDSTSLHSSDTLCGNKSMISSGAVLSSSSMKLKSTAALLLESGSLKPEITNQILSRETPKEPALPTSVIPNAARPRHLQEKPRPQVKVRNKARSKGDMTLNSQPINSPSQVLHDPQRVPLPESSTNGVGDYKVRKFFDSMDVRYTDSEVKLAESGGTAMESFLSIQQASAISLTSQVQEDSSTTSPDLLLPASLDTVKNEPMLREPEKVEETASAFSADGSHFHKKIKKAHRKSRRRRRINLPITNHMDNWPELPPLDATEEAPPDASEATPSNVQNISPPVSCGKVFLTEKLPGRNCLLINRQTGEPLLYELTDSFMAPLDNTTNIHMLPWCCLHGHRYGRGFPADSIERLENIIKRDLPW